MPEKAMARPAAKAHVHVDSYYVDPQTAAICKAAEEGKGKIVLVGNDEWVVPRWYWHLSAGLVIAALMLGLLPGRFLLS
jgi:hypothetical protein